MLNMLSHKLPQIFSRRLGSILEAGELNSGPVILNWMEPSEVPASDYDPNVESSYPSMVSRTATVWGLIHFINQSTVPAQFAEFAAGDAIVTFEGSGLAELTQLQGLTFTLPDEQVYVPSKSGENVCKFYDLVLGGQRMSRTVFLTLK